MNKILRNIGSVYVALMLVLYPIILTDKYYNVTDTKLYCFYILTAFFSLSVFGIKYYEWLRSEDVRKSNNISQFLIVSPIIGVAVISIISTADLKMAVRGTKEYGFGTVFFIMLALAIMAIRLTCFSKQVFSLSAILGAVATSLFGLLQFLGADIFGLIKSVTIEDSNMFISTFGNTSFFGAFMVMIFPIAVYSFLNETPAFKRVSAIAVITTVIGIIIANTDATLLAFIVEMLIILAKKNHQKSLSDVSKTVMLVAGAILLLNGLLILSTRERELGGLQKVFINPVIWLVILFAALIVLALEKRQQSLPIRKTLQFIGKLGLVIVCIFPIASAIYTKITYINLASPLSRLLYFDDNWGNRRGYIWTRALELYGNGTVFEKVLGRGIGSFSELFQRIYGSESFERYFTFFDDAHNMFIQCLLEYGIIGLTLMLTFCSMTLYRLFCGKDEFDYYRAVAFVGMLICSTCLISQNITPAFVVLFM